MISEGEECERDGLARQFAGSQPHREPLGHHEEEAEEAAEHLLPPLPDESHQDHVDQGPAHLTDEEADPLYANQAEDVSEEQGSDDQVLSLFVL